MTVNTSRPGRSTEEEEEEEEEEPEVWASRDVTREACILAAPLDHFFVFKQDCGSVFEPVRDTLFHTSRTCAGLRLDTRTQIAF